MTRRHLLSLLSAATLLATSPARAQEPVPTLPDENPPPPPIAPREPAPPAEPEPPPPPTTTPARAPRYGSPGVFQITNGFGVGGYYTSFDGSEARYGSAYFDPGIDWFIVRNLFIGVEGSFDYTYAKSYGADGSLIENVHTNVGGGVRLGYAIPLGEHVSIAPRISLDVQSVHSTQSVVSGKSSSIGTPLGLPSTTSVGPSISAFLPVLVHPAPHFFLGIGPGFYHLFARTLSDPDAGGQQTTLSVHGVVGIWWGGSPEPDAEEPVPVEAARVRFGSQGQIVLDGDLGASVHATSYANTSSNATQWSVSPGIDYFVADRVSLGVGVSIGGVHSEELAPPTSATASPVKVTSDATNISLMPRIGVDLPLGRAFSFYPRANIALGVKDRDSKTATSENKYSETVVSIGLYAPLLFHVGEHAFVGFGPSVYHELSAKVDRGGDIPATTIGGRLIVGGWL